jgi:hypothetical protein
MRIVKNMILAFIISATISSCGGQSKTDTKNKEFDQNLVGKTVSERKVISCTEIMIKILRFKLV